MKLDTESCIVILLWCAKFQVNTSTMASSWDGTGQSDFYTPPPLTTMFGGGIKRDTIWQPKHHFVDSSVIVLDNYHGNAIGICNNILKIMCIIHVYILTWNKYMPP